MRRTLVFLLLLTLAVPLGARGAEAAPGDGTLSVKNGDGVVALNLRGVVLGFVGKGKLEIERGKPADCDALDVWGAERERSPARRDQLGRTVVTCFFAGKDVRFRLASGANQLRIEGQNISLSAVGAGFVALDGDGGQQDGLFALNGPPYRSLPDERQRFEVGRAAPSSAQPG